MATQLLSLHVLCLIIIGSLANPAPGRIPKVYNALITSNQNLEPSKAYPVYQPVIHDTAFTFPFHPAVFYGADYPLTNGLLPIPAETPKDPSARPLPVPSPEAPTEAKTPSSEAPPAPTPEQSPEPESPGNSTPAPPPPPTQSPIPLNGFGLPPHVLPLGRVDPAYEGFTHVGPFTYTYPGLRFYDPYDPFGFNPYPNIPIYRPLTNVLGQNSPVPASREPEVAPVPSTASNVAGQTPPPEPSDLNVLNYASKDPAIPNVPPPPLPQGGLKTDKAE